MSTILQYLSAIVALSAALIAITGKPKWDASQRGFRQLTPTGRLTAFLAVLAFFFTVSLTWRAQEVAKEQRTQRERVMRVAHTELRLAIRLALHPFYEVLESNQQTLDLVPSNLDMLDQNIRSKLGEVDLNEQFPYAIGKSSWCTRPRWGKVFEEAANRAYIEIDRVKQTYAAYLESYILVSLSNLQRDELLTRLRELDDNVTLNVGEMKYPEPCDIIINPLAPRTEQEQPVVRDWEPFPFIYAEPVEPNPDAWGYERFWELIAELDKSLIKDEKQLRNLGKE